MRHAIIMAAAVVLAACATARADDTIRTTSGIGISGAITGADSEGIVIRVDGVPRTIPLVEVAKLESSKYADLTQAEAALVKGRAGGGTAAANLAKAEKLYRGLIDKTTSPAWLKGVAGWRLCEVYALSGRVDAALDAFLNVANTNPVMAGIIRLPKPRAGDAANADMAAKVDAALKAAGSQGYVNELKTFRAALTVMIGGGKGTDELAAARELRKSATDKKTRDWAAGKELGLLLDAGKVDDAEKVLAEMTLEWKDRAPDQGAFWKGRMLQARGTYIPAALEFMRVVILYPQGDKSRLAESLLRAGQAMEAGKSPPNEAMAAYKEAVTNYAGTPAAKQAEKELARLSGGAARK